MKTIDVAAAIIEENGRFYITQRSEGEFAGMWEFPGGKIDAGETAEEALKREIFEELSAEISIDRHVTTVEYAYPTFHLRMQCFLCTLSRSTVPQLNVHSAARWVTAQEASDFTFLPADADIIADLQSLVRSQV